MQINSTELSGFFAFVPATIASAAAWSGSRERGSRRAWAIFAGIYALLSVEILVSSRHLIDQAIGDWLRTEHLYPERRPPQAIAIFVLLVVGLILATLVLRRAPTPPLKLATGATAAVLILFIVEGVSLHALDAVFYRPIGPIMLIGWLWLACGLTTVGAATLRLFNNASRGTS